MIERIPEIGKFALSLLETNLLDSSHTHAVCRNIKFLSCLTVGPLAALQEENDI